MVRIPVFNSLCNLNSQVLRGNATVCRRHSLLLLLLELVPGLVPAHEHDTRRYPEAAVCRTRSPRRQKGIYSSRRFRQSLESYQQYERWAGRSRFGQLYVVGLLNGALTYNHVLKLVLRYKNTSVRRKDE